MLLIKEECHILLLNVLFGCYTLHNIYVKLIIVIYPIATKHQDNMKEKYEKLKKDGKVSS